MVRPNSSIQLINSSSIHRKNTRLLLTTRYHQFKITNSIPPTQNHQLDIFNSKSLPRYLQTDKSIPTTYNNQLDTTNSKTLSSYIIRFNSLRSSNSTKQAKTSWNSPILQRTQFWNNFRHNYTLHQLIANNFQPTILK